MESTITIGNTSVFYREKGQGKTILILHGWGSNSSQWEGVQDSLVELGFRVIVPDLPGFGRTKEPSSPWNIKDYTVFIRNFITALNLYPHALVGHSFGGRIAISYTHEYGKELGALVLCNAAGILRHKKEKVNLFLFLTKIGNLIFSIPFLRFARPPLRKLLYKVTGSQDYYQADGNMREIFKRVLSENLRSHLPHITTPTLILWGEHDVITPLQDARIIHESIPQSYLHVFPGVGHGINLEIPDKVAEYISTFVRS